MHCAHHWIVELLRHIDDLRSVALIAEAHFRSGDERTDKQESLIMASPIPLRRAALAQILHNSRLDQGEPMGSQVGHFPGR